MSEPKMALPPYKNVGACGRCGASVYAPEEQATEGQLPWMSACACARGPRLGKVSKVKAARRAGEPRAEVKAMTA